MVATNPSTISLKGKDLFMYNEALANEALSPGHLVELLSTGKVQKNDTVAGVIQLAVATEQEYLGKEITEAYAADDQVIYVLPQRGGEVYVRVAAGEGAITKGERLEAVAGGTVQTFASGSIVGIALESVDNSGGGAEVFIRMQVI